MKERNRVENDGGVLRYVKVQVEDSLDIDNTLKEELEKRNKGATIIPVIISSDKTQLTLFRNKTAEPV